MSTWIDEAAPAAILDYIGVARVRHLNYLRLEAGDFIGIDSSRLCSFRKAPRGTFTG